MNTQPTTHQTYYADYLQLDTLLDAQKPLSDVPDELHFIIIHQIHELWFKLALRHMERARAGIQTDDLAQAVRLINQVAAIFENARHTVEHLHSLPPAAFHGFRHLLAPGSGMQSYQFREIEFLGGIRDAEHQKWTAQQLAEDAHWQRVKKRLDEPSLNEAFMALLARAGVDDIAAIYADPAAAPDLYRLCDSLSALEHRVLLWRQSHIQLIERTIGAGVMGTGGTTHDYLQATLRRRFFPALWAARDTLTRRTNQPSSS